MELFEYYNLPSQQSSRKPQAFQKRARSQTEFPAWRGPSVTHFGSVSNHFPKKFHFYGKFLSPCSTSNKIIWDLGRNEGKVGRGKAETYKNMSVESLCSLVGMNRFFCFLGFFFLCVYFIFIFPKYCFKVSLLKFFSPFNFFFFQQRNRNIVCIRI